MEKDQSKEKSVKRARKTAVKLADILARQGADLVPGGNLAYDVITLLLKQYFDDQRDDRLKRFHEAMLSEDPDGISTKDVLNKEFSTEDYYSLVSACIQDNEAKKTRHYGWFMRNIIAGNVPSRYKIHFLRTLRELTAEELDYARKVYIHSHYDMMTAGGVSAQIDSILHQGDAMDIVQKQSLERHGLLGKDVDGKLVPSDVLKDFVSVIYGQAKLIPEAIGRSAWIGARVLIIDYGLADNSRVATEVEKLLWDKNIKATIGTVNRRNIQQINLSYYGCIILQGLSSIPDECRPALGQLKTKVTIKLIFNQSSEDQIPDVSCDHFIVCPGHIEQCLTELDSLVDLYLNEYSHRSREQNSRS